MADEHGGDTKRRTLSRRFLAMSLVGIVALVLAGVLVMRGMAGSVSTLVVGTPLPVSGPSAQVEAGGLTLSMRISNGPYFLGELIAVNLSLANRSQTTYTLQGTPIVNACGQVVNPVLTGGGPPEIHLGLGVPFSCPLKTTQMPPGQAWNLYELVPLTESGQVTLTAQSRLFSVTIGPDGQTIKAGTSAPFNDHWPTLHLSVAPQAPSQRTIALHITNGLATVSAPSEAMAHLYYSYQATCGHYPDAGSAGTGNFLWQPVTTLPLREPPCPGSDEIWSVSVGAPGYALSTVVYPST